MIILFEAPPADTPGYMPTGYRAIRASGPPPEKSWIAVPGSEDGRHEVVELDFAADLEMVTIALGGMPVRDVDGDGAILPGWYATEAEALAALDPKPTPALPSIPSGFAALAAREAMPPPKPRRRLNWHHFPDADRSMIDARARLRFTPNPIEGAGPGWSATTTMTIEVGTVPFRQGGEPDRQWSHFNARLGFDHRSGAGLAHTEVLLGDGIDALTHAIRMAEEWVAAFVGPGWSPLTVDDARRSHPPPALPEPQAAWSTGDVIMVHFEDGADPLLLSCDRDRCGLTWFRPDDPEHPGYESGTEVIDGHRIDRVEEVER